MDARDHKGRTPLHRAAYQGLRDIAPVLVEHGAELGALDDDGRTPLDIATVSQEAEMASWLETAIVSAGLRLDSDKPEL